MEAYMVQDPGYIPDDYQLVMSEGEFVISLSNIMRRVRHRLDILEGSNPSVRTWLTTQQAATLYDLQAQTISKWARQEAVRACRDRRMIKGRRRTVWVVHPGDVKARVDVYHLRYPKGKRRLARATPADL